MQKIRGDGLGQGVDVARLNVVRDSQVYGRALAIQHALDRAAQLVIEQAHIGNAVGLGRHGSEDAAVVESPGGSILKKPHALHVIRDLARDDEDRRLIAQCCRNRGHGVGHPGAADAQAYAEPAAGPRVAVGHVGRPALLCRNDGDEVGGAPEGWKEGIDQTAGDHEHMIDSVGNEGLQYEIGAEHFQPALAARERRPSRSLGC